MEAVAFGGKDAIASSGLQDWSNLQFGNRTADTSNRVNFLRQIHLLI